MTKWFQSFLIVFQSFFHLVRLFIRHTSAPVLHSPYPCPHTHNPKQPPPRPLHTRTQPRTVSPPRSVRSQPVCDPREQAHAHHCELQYLFTLFHCCSHRLRSGAYQCVHMCIFAQRGLCVMCSLRTCTGSYRILCASGHMWEYHCVVLCWFTVAFKLGFISVYCGSCLGFTLNVNCRCFCITILMHCERDSKLLILSQNAALPL